jgi:hypothetical protein
MAFLLLVGALPVHGAHADHGNAPTETVQAEAGADHHAHGDPGAGGAHHGHDAPPDDSETPCPRGPCDAGAPACAVTLEAPALPSLSPGAVLVAPPAGLGEFDPPAVLVKPPFRPPRLCSVPTRVNPAG